MSSSDLVHHGVYYDVATYNQKPTVTVNELKVQAIKYVRIIMVDLVNNIKYRIVPLEYFEKLLGTSRPGTTIAKAIFGIIFGGIASGFGPTGEYLYAFDLTTLRIRPHAPGYASVLGWFEEKLPHPNVEGHRRGAVEVDICPRTILRRVVEDAKSIGVEFLGAAAFLSGSVETQVLEEIAECLTASGVELQMYHSELAAGQYEVITGPLSPLQSVDALIHTRDIIFNVASKHGLRATFAPRVFGDSCGSATHTHISIHSVKTSRASSIHPNLSYIESTFLAGLLRNLFSIALLALPTTMSFKRMVDYLSAGGTYVCWGTDNREAQIRLCNASSPLSRNFEIKCLDGIANPYVAVAAFISAGMDGVSRDVECQIRDCGLGPETTAANMGEENRKKLGITERMPLTWEEAESAFAGSKLVDDVFGSNFKQTYLSVNKTLGKQMSVGHTEEGQLTKWVENY